MVGDVTVVCDATQIAQRYHHHHSIHAISQTLSLSVKILLPTPTVTKLCRNLCSTSSCLLTHTTVPTSPMPPLLSVDDHPRSGSRGAEQQPHCVERVRVGVPRHAFPFATHPVLQADIRSSAASQPTFTTRAQSHPWHKHPVLFFRAHFVWLLHTHTASSAGSKRSSSPRVGIQFICSQIRTTDPNFCSQFSKV